MIDEGFIPIKWRRFGPAAFLRRKQWWSFEGLDEERGVYFVFLAMQSFPAGYVALTIIDTNSGQRTAEEHLAGIKAMSGDSVSVSSDGKWGRLHFSGRAEDKWQVEVDTASIKAKVIQTPRGPMHRNRLQTKTIDYSILQSVRNDIECSISFSGKEHKLSGYGYYEHAWGVQARLSVANWLHFWSPQVSGVVMDCQYDAGIPHNYTLIQTNSEQYYLHAPAAFSFDGEAVIKGITVPIVGIGKYDHNINKW